MEKNINPVSAEDLESYKEELRITIEELKKVKPKVEPGPPDEKNVNDELERLRKIVGDFHPGPKSPTYRELHDENQKLKQKIDELKSAIEKLEKENADLRGKVAKMEQEIIHLRNHPVQVQMPVPAPEAKEPEKKQWFFRKKDVPKSETEKLPRSEEEMRKDLNMLLFSPRFADAQVELLAEILSKDKGLPVKALVQIVDPRLSTDKIRTLYMLLCVQYHTKPVIDTKIAAVVNPFPPDEPEEQPSEEQADTSTSDTAFATTANSGSGGQTKGSIPHQTVQRTEGGKKR